MKTSSFHSSTALLLGSPAPGSAGSPSLNPSSKGDRATLAGIARQAMIERGLEPDFPPAAPRELAAIDRPADETSDLRDLRERLAVCERLDFRRTVTRASWAGVRMT